MRIKGNPDFLIQHSLIPVLTLNGSSRSIWITSQVLSQSSTYVLLYTCWHALQTETKPQWQTHKKQHQQHPFISKTICSVWINWFSERWETLTWTSEGREAHSCPFFLEFSSLCTYLCPCFPYDYFKTTTIFFKWRFHANMRWHEYNCIHWKSGHSMDLTWLQNIYDPHTVLTSYSVIIWSVWSHTGLTGVQRASACIFHSGPAHQVEHLSF